MIGHCPGGLRFEYYHHLNQTILNPLSAKRLFSYPYKVGGPCLFGIDPFSVVSPGVPALLRPPPQYHWVPHVAPDAKENLVFLQKFTGVEIHSAVPTTELSLYLHQVTEITNK